MNTRIRYEYRDASNYYWHGELVVSGEMTAELWQRIRKACESGRDFIAHQVGITEVFGYRPGPHHDDSDRPDGYPYDEDDDHCWHAFEDDPGAWEVTTDAPTDERTVKQLVAAFEISFEAGWIVFHPAERFGL